MMLSSVMPEAAKALGKVAFNYVECYVKWNESKAEYNATKIQLYFGTFKN